MTNAKVSRRGKAAKVMARPHLFNFYLERSHFEALQVIANQEETSVAALLRDMAATKVAPFFANNGRQNHRDVVDSSPTEEGNA